MNALTDSTKTNTSFPQSCSALQIFLLLASCYWLAACGGGNSSSSAPAAPPEPPAPPANLTVSGSIQDGPVSGGTLFIFTVDSIIAAIANAEQMENATTALTASGPSASLTRDPVDGDRYSLEIPGDLAGQALFFVFDATGSKDMTFNDQPFRMESVIIAGDAGSRMRVNVTPHTTMAAMLVRNALDPDGDGTPLDTAGISTELDSALTMVKEAIGLDDLGEPLFPENEDPITTTDDEVLEVASTTVGRLIRASATVLGLTRAQVINALATDASDGDIDGAASGGFALTEDELDVIEDVAGFTASIEGAGDDLLIASCSASSISLQRSCRFDAVEGLFETLAKCSDSTATDEDLDTCLAEATSEQDEALEECEEVFEARQNLCEDMDDATHNPAFGADFAANFVNPLQIGTGVIPHPFFPLVQGNRWVYEGTSVDDEGEEVTETITVTVTNKTKMIGGISCLVVNDQVVEDGELIEDTDDWYAQDTAGNIWYCGEIAQNFEQFDGDNPGGPELVDIDGSWKAGRDRAKAGILLPAAPVVGDVIRQEILYGNAEDIIDILDLEGTESSPAASCTGTCLVTRDYTPLEPDAEENKYYAPGIGLIVELDTETGDRVELVTFENLL